MEKELIKEKATVFLEEHNVPAVVVKEFDRGRSDTIKRQWLVYKKAPEDNINVELPEVYIVKYKLEGQEYSTKYSREGELIETNRLVNLTVLPEESREMLQNGDYKDWKVVGDVLELLDNNTGEPASYIVTLEKTGTRERVFFNRDGETVKIQKLM